LSRTRQEKNRGFHSIFSTRAKATNPKNRPIKKLLWFNFGGHLRRVFLEQGVHPTSFSTSTARRRFDAPFKLHAAQLVRDRHLSVPQVCDDLNVADSSLRRWLAQYDAERSDHSGSSSPLTPEQQRIRALEIKNRQLRQEVGILKKHRPSSPGNWRIMQPSRKCSNVLAFDRE